MDPFQAIPLFVLISVPILAVVACIALLWLGRERGTLLLPRERPCPAFEPSESIVEAPAAAVAHTAAPANDECARKAA